MEPGSRSIALGWLLLAFSIFLCDTGFGQWKSVKLDNRDYVALSDFAAYYGMKSMGRRKDKRETGYSSKSHSIIVKNGSREALLDGVRHWFSFPTRGDRRGNPYISMVDIQMTIGPAYHPDRINLPQVKTVVFDPGHGGHDRGATSPYGAEKDYALDLVNRTRRILESRGIKVVQSRLSDFLPTLKERPEMTENYEKPIFVSVHFNSASWKPSASGYEIYAIPPVGCPATGRAEDSSVDGSISDGHRNLAPSFVMANTIHHTVLGRVSGTDRGVKRSRFAVLRYAKVPAVLIECGFLTNPNDAKLIHSSQWREKFATALADGIVNYMNLANAKKLPPRATQLGRKPANEFVLEVD